MKTVGKNSAFFHTLVIMGGSLAGCGGQAQEESQGREGDGDQAGSGGSGRGGQPGAGGSMVGTGGVVSTGGHLGDGDGDLIIITSGGTNATGGNYMGGAHGLGCPPEQWACSNIPYDCSWQTAEILDVCTCDASKPTRPEDCPAGTVLTCMEGIEYNPETSEARSEPFSCSCLPEQETCRAQCQSFNISYGDCFEPSADFQGYLCGCEIPVLR